ncbi:MAG TPA: hypothetical protein VKA65_18320 [Acidimicrobiales bacterium]|nr:hypothetical protein [Acidimicrobiales bacterium]
MRRVRPRTLAVAVAAAALLLGATGCDPIENAPPGGGEVIVANYRIGPFNLAPEGQSGSESQGSRSNLPRPSGAFGMKAIDFDIVDAAGNPVGHQDVHLHHVVLMNPARQSQFCGNWPERFAASGSERTPIRFPDPYAYMVGAGESWSGLWHIMNESTTTRQVYIQYKVAYQPGATATNTRGVTPFFLDVTGCTNSEYDVPGDGGAGSVHTNTRTWSAPWNGYMVGAGGHLHAGGINIGLRDEATGLECTMKANYEHSHGEHGAPGSIDTCPLHVRVSAGQRFSVVSRYDNSQPWEGVMGIVMAYAWQGTQ